MPQMFTALLVAGPFLIGLNRPLAWTLWAIVLTVFVLIKPESLAFGDSKNSAPFTRNQQLVLAGTALFAFCVPAYQILSGTCQTLPSSSACVADPESSWLSLIFAVMVFLWFLLLLGPSRPKTNDVLITLAIAGGAQAFYALACLFTGVTPLFLEHVFHHEGVAVGGFPNRNHLAAFLYICIYSSIALVLVLPVDTGTGRAARWRLLLDKRLLWRLTIIVMVIALISTRSRAGNASFIIGLAAGFGWLMFVEKRRKRNGEKTLRWGFVAFLVASILLLDTVLIGSFVGLDKVEQRLSDTTLEGESRADVNAALIAKPEVFTVLGHGAGSFVKVFAPMKPSEIPGIYRQAHNDYFQVVIERGIVGAGIFAATFLLAGLLVLGKQDSGKNNVGPAIRFAWVASTTALLTHATVEYVTQEPSIWLAWTALTALGIRSGLRSRRRSA